MDYVGVTCHAADGFGHSPESLLREKLNSLGQQSSSINSFFKNMINGRITSTQNAALISGRLKETEKTRTLLVSRSGILSEGFVSEESVRSLNAKRRKVAKRLLHRIRSLSKQDATLPMDQKKAGGNKSIKTCNVNNKIVPYSIVCSTTSVQLSSFFSETSGTAPVDEAFPRCLASENLLRPGQATFNVAVRPRTIQKHPSGDSPISTPNTTKCSEENLNGSDYSCGVTPALTLSTTKEKTRFLTSRITKANGAISMTPPALMSGAGDSRTSISMSYV